MSCTEIQNMIYYYSRDCHDNSFIGKFTAKLEHYL